MNTYQKAKLLKNKQSLKSLMSELDQIPNFWGFEKSARSRFISKARNAFIDLAMFLGREETLKCLMEINQAQGPCIKPFSIRIDPLRELDLGEGGQ